MGCVISNHIDDNLRNEIIESKRLYQKNELFKLDKNLNKSKNEIYKEIKDKSKNYK